jgi:hypothetical protein
MVVALPAFAQGNNNQGNQGNGSQNKGSTSWGGPPNSTTLGPNQTDADKRAAKAQPLMATGADLKSEPQRWAPRKTPVFVIQNSQNRDNAALQAKLDELIRSSSARNELAGIEKLTKDEIETLRNEIGVRQASNINATEAH